MRALAPVVELRPQVRRECADLACGAPLTRSDRDGHLSLVGSVRPMREALPFRERLAIGFVLICAIAIVMLSRSYGEKVGPAVDEAREEDAAPRGGR
jgi:hypothetical protein